MIKIKKNRVIKIISIIFLLVMLSLIINLYKDFVMVNEIKKSYMNNTSLTSKQIDRIQYKLDKRNKLNEDEYFALGYLNLYEYDNPDKAYQYFERIIEKIENVKYNFVKVYTYKFLSDKYKADEDIEKAIEYTKKACYSIGTKNHGEYRNLMNDIFRPIIDIEEGRLLIIEFLEYVLEENYKYPDKDAELYAYRTLQEFYTIKGDYPNAIGMTIKSIVLSHEMDKQFFKGKSILNLAYITWKLEYDEKLYDMIEEVKKVEIKIEDRELNDKLNVYLRLLLSQIEIKNKKYNQAIDYINEIDKHNKNLPIEDQQDIEIISNIIKAKIYIINNELYLAQKCLNKARNVMDLDDIVYIPDKDVYYLLVAGSLKESQSQYNEAIEYYKKAKEISIERNNINYIEVSVSNLQNLYSKLGKIEISNAYSQEIKCIDDYKRQKTNKDYYDYIITIFKKQNINYKNKVITIFNKSLAFIIIIFAICMYLLNIHPKMIRYKLKRKIKRYIKNDNYMIYYQPIINANKSIAVGFESLLRLKIKDEIIMPYILIKEIEKSDMMGVVSIWILEKAIKDYKIISQIENVLDEFYLSINISIKEIEDDSIVNKMIEVMRKSGLNKKSICIEITENKGIKNIDKVKLNVLKLRESGFKIAIDDFGVEYSNLAIIETIEFDIVKIDKIFINDIQNSSLNKSIMKSVEFIFAQNGKNVVIEGVEEVEQVNFIKNIKSENFYIQGYFYCRPVELKELSANLEFIKKLVYKNENDITQI